MWVSISSLDFQKVVFFVSFLTPFAQFGHFAFYFLVSLQISGFFLSLLPFFPFFLRSVEVFFIGTTGFILSFSIILFSVYIFFFLLFFFLQWSFFLLVSSHFYGISGSLQRLLFSFYFSSLVSLQNIFTYFISFVCGFYVSHIPLFFTYLRFFVYLFSLFLYVSCFLLNYFAVDLFIFIYLYYLLFISLIWLINFAPCVYLSCLFIVYSSTFI